MVAAKKTLESGICVFIKSPIKNEAVSLRIIVEIKGTFTSSKVN
jgi:hypothetical protein